MRAAADDRDPALRVAAMNAAGELGRAGNVLAAAHLSDPDLDVRLAAARAVIATGDHDTALPALVGALATPRRLDAADELARLGDPRGLGILRAAARAKDAHERRIALAALAPLPDGRTARRGLHETTSRSASTPPARCSGTCSARERFILSASSPAAASAERMTFLRFNRPARASARE